MDALGFIGDCLLFGVEEACDFPHRGGFERLLKKGIKGPMKFEIYYRQEKNSRPISYSLHIDLGNDGRPFVTYERLRQRRKGQSRGQSYSFLEMTKGEGFAWAGEATEKEEGNKKIEVKLEDKQRLGITTLGNLADHPRIVAFIQFLRGLVPLLFCPRSRTRLAYDWCSKALESQGRQFSQLCAIAMV